MQNLPNYFIKERERLGKLLHLLEAKPSTLRLQSIYEENETMAMFEDPLIASQTENSLQVALVQPVNLWRTEL